MRVIAGSARGVRLARPADGVRPLSDRAREGLFSSLGSVVDGARVLDLFAGTGAIGIEALSRGAARATLVDWSRPAVATIHDNLERTGVAEAATVVVADALAFLRRDRPLEGPFDLVFLDPPYELGAPDLDDVLGVLAGGWLAEPPWTVAMTRGKKSSTPVIPIHWAAARQLRYGDSLVTLFREVGWA
ncbi:MAG: 16S rRNA (guanine(966)-N(2))-methyltransferase RsmD [Actinomycetota bacterium]|nr:16S rRNA (guanine(966)-N(2))-methyltransferase RsmD [Actinomycetota bacterium]